MTDVSRLPGPVMELWEWQYQGACRDVEDTSSSTPKANVDPRAVVGQKRPKQFAQHAPS